jgi:hypothetical protein
MGDVVLTVLICAACAAGFVALADFISVRLWHEQLDEQGLSLSGLFRHKAIPYWQIESVQSIWLDFFQDESLSGFRVRWWTTRCFVLRLVVVRHRDGKALICTPEDPAAFVRTLTERIGGAAPPKLPQSQRPR